MSWRRELVPFCSLSAVLCACHGSMRARADASGSAEDLAACLALAK